MLVAGVTIRQKERGQNVDRLQLSGHSERLASGASLGYYDMTSTKKQYERSALI